MHTASRLLLWTLGILLLLIVLGAVALRLLDWNLFKDEIAAQLGQRLGTDVAIQGDLDVGFDDGVLRVQAGGVRVEDSFASAQPLLDLERLEAGVALTPLLRGELVFDHIVLTQPRVTLIHEGDGDVNWDFGRERPDAAAERAAPILPPVRRLEIRGGSVVYHDRLLDETLRASIDQFHGRFLPEDVAELRGTGDIDGRNLALDAEARYLAQADDWRVDAELAIADARLAVHGVPGAGGVDLRLDVPEPAQLEFLPLPDEIQRIENLRIAGHIEREHGGWRASDLRLAVGEHQVTGEVRLGADGELEARAAVADARLSVTGSLDEPDLRIEAVAPDPGQLDFLPLPDLPAGNPASLTTRLTRDQGHWWLDGLEVVLGEQRLDGDVRIDADQEPPMIYATLRLNALPLPETDDEERDQLIPPAELPTEALRLVNVRADLRIGRVTNTPIALNDIELEVELTNGRLAVRPASLDVAGGELEGRVIYDASAAPPSATVRLALRGLQLAGAPPADDPQVTGEVSGNIDLHGRGPTAQALAGSLDGQLLFVMRDGSINASWVEALDLDLGEWLLATGAPGTARTPIRCALVAFTVQSGVLSAEPVVIDTRDSVIVLEGQIGLGTEQMKLSLEAFPKDASLLSIESNIRVEGTLTEPTFDVLDADTAGQGAIALALGALAGPLAALVPFLDPGLTEDQNCAQLLGDEPEGSPPQGKQ